MLLLLPTCSAVQWKKALGREHPTPLALRPCMCVVAYREECPSKYMDFGWHDPLIAIDGAHACVCHRNTHAALLCIFQEPCITTKAMEP